MECGLRLYQVMVEAFVDADPADLRREWMGLESPLLDDVDEVRRALRGQRFVSGFMTRRWFGKKHVLRLRKCMLHQFVVQVASAESADVEDEEVARAVQRLRCAAALLEAEIDML